MTFGWYLLFLQNENENKNKKWRTTHFKRHYYNALFNKYNVSFNGKKNKYIIIYNINFILHKHHIWKYQTIIKGWITTENNYPLYEAQIPTFEKFTN